MIGMYLEWTNVQSFVFIHVVIEHDNLESCLESTDIILGKMDYLEEFESGKEVAYLLNSNIMPFGTFVGFSYMGFL